MHRAQYGLLVALQATSGGGGWPMSVWLTPDLHPLVGGTYFPPEGRYFGRPGFKTVLESVADRVSESFKQRKTTFKKKDYFCCEKQTSAK